tara:strand:- start:64 stop:351 length:288 start_codon:yes stop_codon:yes gene_type:complete
MGNEKQTKKGSQMENQSKKDQLVYRVGDATGIEEIYVGAWVSYELVKLINDGFKAQGKALIKTATFPKHNDPKYMHILWEEVLRVVDQHDRMEVA